MTEREKLTADLRKYKDQEGNDCTIQQMIKREPEWVANIFQQNESKIKALQDENEGQASVVERLDKMNDKLAERNGVLILENMGLKAQVKNFKFDRDNLNAKIKALQAENERLRKEIDEMDEEYTDPCDVDGCSNQACCGGTSWRESGYWRVCSSHSANARKGGQQPKMRQSSVDREATRDERGYLPSDSELKEIS